MKHSLRSVLALALGCGLAAYSTRGQTAPQPLSTGSRTDISAEHLELMSTETETRGLFRGNVVVTGNNIRVTCDRLEVIAAGVGKKDEITNKADQFKYLLATGQVRIIQGDREANCGRAEIFPKEDRILLTEKPVVIDHGSDAVFTGEPLELFRGERQVKGTNVKVSFPQLKDLGFDKKAPPPKAETPAPAAPVPTQPAPTPPSPK